MLTDAELASMRGTQEAAMPDSADIYRNTRADDGFGGTTVTAVTKVSGPHPARFAQAQVIETPGMARDMEKEVWVVRLPHDTAINDGDLVLWVEKGIVIKITDSKPRSYGTALSLKGESVKGIDLGV